MKCKVCGTEFEPKKEDKYIVKVTKRTGMVTADIETYDAFDCPKCGCQQLAGLRHLEMTEPIYKTVTFDLKENGNE
jgi:DNA-directed RNA polymerase subunit RPC12/RpoP